MIAELTAMLEPLFMRRALLVGLLVALCAALLGVCLVLKRYSMIGDGLSHVGFGSLAIATALGWAPLSVSVPAVIAAAFLLLRISENGRIKGDSAIALISTGSLAVGIIAISLPSVRARGANIDLSSYMFGSILSLTSSDVVVSSLLSAVVLILFIIFYNKIFSVTFDESFARATGTRVSAYNMLIAFLTAITIVLGMRMMGTLLISSLLIFPALTAMRICRRFKSVVICASVVSSVCFFIGLSVSFFFDLPCGASVVCANLIFFLLFSIIGVTIPRKA